MIDPLILGLLRGLPEKQIGRDRGAEDCHQRRQDCGTPSDMGYQDAEKGLLPRYVSGEDGGNIGEENERHPL
jgi:hypothetical protein